MIFRLNDFTFANKIIKLRSDQESNLENTFSLITGINAVGKSRLLTSIIQSHLSHDRTYNHFQTDSILIDHKIAMPNKIIAITNSFNDKFPVKNNKSTIYEYFGNKSNGIIIYDKYSSIKKLILRKEINYSSICHTFNYLKLIPFLKINFNYTFPKRLLSHINIRGIYERNIELLNSVNFKFNIENPSHEELLFFYILDKVYENKKIIKKIEFYIIYEFFSQKNNMNSRRPYITYNFYEQYYTSSISIEALSIFIENNILKIHQVNLKTHINKNQPTHEDENLIDFNSLSSGQQALLNIFLSLSSCIENNSLICIDEPEISLHPKWQMDFIIKLQELFTEYTGCHFIIATHSPQIISGLNTKNGFVIDLEKNITYSSEEYSKKSADFQLAKIFNSPGYNNEYIIKICLYLLSKIKDQVSFNNNDVKSISELKGFQLSLKDDDPVYYLVKEVISLSGL